MAVAVVSHRGMLRHDPGKGHAEGPERLAAVLARLEQAQMPAGLVRREARRAERRWLETVHSARYIDEVEAACARGGGVLDEGDTVVSRESWDAALLAAGAVLDAVDIVVAGEAPRAFAAVRPPGHHAEHDRAMGFCLFNNIAIAARYAQRQHGLARVLIVDFDVHHGNGTQNAFYQDPSVLFCSSHQFPFYPGSGGAGERGAGPGLGFTLNLPLPAGAGEAELLALYERELVPAANTFRPDLVLASAGFDAHRLDPLAELRLETESYRRITRMLLGIAGEHAGGRLVSVLEGGYDLGALSESVAAHLEELAV